METLATPPRPLHSNSVVNELLVLNGIAKSTTSIHMVQGMSTEGFFHSSVLWCTSDWTTHRRSECGVHEGPNVSIAAGEHSDVFSHPLDVRTNTTRTR